MHTGLSGLKQERGLFGEVNRKLHSGAVICSLCDQGDPGNFPL